HLAVLAGEPRGDRVLPFAEHVGMHDVLGQPSTVARSERDGEVGSNPVALTDGMTVRAEAAVLVLALVSHGDCRRVRVALTGLRRLPAREPVGDDARGVCRVVERGRACPLPGRLVAEE